MISFTNSNHNSVSSENIAINAYLDQIFFKSDLENSDRLLTNKQKYSTIVTFNCKNWNLKMTMTNMGFFGNHSNSATEIFS